jgi:putative MFS transporter
MFFDSVDSLSLSFVLPVLARQWHINHDQIGTMIAANFFGGAIGAICCGWLAEKFGRMRLITFTVALYAIMSFLCAFSWSFNSLLVFRLIQGFGLGGEIPIAHSYINEWSTSRGRGKYFLFYSVLFAVGGLCAALLGVWVVPSFGWRYMFFIGTLPAIIAIYLRWSVPESPRWLASKGRLEEADRVLSRAEYSISKGGTLPLPPIVPVTVVGPGKKTRLAELFQGIYLRRTIVLWMLVFCSAFVNLGLSSWMPMIFSQVFKLPLRQSLTYGMYLSVIIVMSGIGAALLVDHIGRKTWFSAMAIIGAFFFFCVSFIKPANPTTFLAWMLSGMLFCSSTPLVTTLYMGEIYPTRMRALGSSVSRIFYGIATTLSPITIGFIIQRFGLYPVPFMLASVFLVMGILAAIFAIETKGRVLEEIAP